MTPAEFQDTLAAAGPPQNFSAPVAALWWDAKGDWQRAHSLVDELSTIDGMAVHAYLHRKEGSLSNADYWYSRAGRTFYRSVLNEEYQALLDDLLPRIGSAH